MKPLEEFFWDLMANHHGILTKKRFVDLPPQSKGRWRATARKFADEVLRREQLNRSQKRRRQKA